MNRTFAELRVSVPHWEGDEVLPQVYKDWLDTLTEEEYTTWVVGCAQIVKDNADRRREMEKP